MIGLLQLIGLPRREDVDDLRTMLGHKGKLVGILQVVHVLAKG